MRNDEQLMDALAEMVAEGVSLATAARRLGISTFKRNALWMHICARLGDQAR